MIRCPVCGAILSCLTSIHTAQHGFESKEKFLEAYPEARKKTLILYGNNKRKIDSLYGQERYYGKNIKKR